MLCGAVKHGSRKDISVIITIVSFFYIYFPVKLNTSKNIIDPEAQWYSRFGVSDPVNLKIWVLSWNECVKCEPQSFFKPPARIENQQRQRSFGGCFKLSEELHIPKFNGAMQLFECLKHTGQSRRQTLHTLKKNLFMFSCSTGI